MILIDKPVNRPRFGLTAHAISSKHGPEGTAELLEFAKKVGLQENWLQNRGRWNEHFDLMRGVIYKARRMDGVQFMGSKDLMRVLITRRELYKESEVGDGSKSDA